MEKEKGNKYTIIFGLNNIFPMNDSNIFNLGLRNLFRMKKWELNKFSDIIMPDNVAIPNIIIPNDIVISNKTEENSKIIILDDIEIKKPTSSYKINKNNTLTYPDGHNEEIISAEICGANISYCFNMIPGTSYNRHNLNKMQFGKTNKTLEFYKKTIVINNNNNISQVLTTIVVPSGTDIFFGSPSLSNTCSKRISKAIVREQHLIENDKIITESSSIRDHDFKYITNQIITPSNGFDSHGEWAYDGHPSYSAGIHVFSTKDKAKNYDWD